MKEGWEIKKLSDICESIKNIRWIDIPTSSSFPYIDLSAVDRNNSAIISSQLINNTNAPSRAKQIVKSEDVIFATTRPTLRRLCIIPPKYNDAICSTGFCVLRHNKEVLTKWIFYSLKCDVFYAYIEPLQKGANYPAITDGEVKKYTIPVPPLSEQKRIVDILDREFARIDALKANAIKSYHLARELFQSALKKELQPKEGWEKYKLQDVCTEYGIYGMSLPSKKYTGIRYLRITDITDMGELNDDIVSADTDVVDDKYILQEGDILFARTGATVGKTLVYDKNMGVCSYAGYLIRYRLNSSLILPKIMYYITHSNAYYKWIVSNQKSATLPNISAKLYNLYEIAIPNTLSKQEQIVTRLDKLNESCKELKRNYIRIGALCEDMKQALLRKAFNGEL